MTPLAEPPKTNSYCGSGLDPELFVLDGDGYIVPGELFLDGDKEAPVAYDNAAVELRPAPAYCLASFNGTVRELLYDAYRKMRVARMKGKIPRTSHMKLVSAAPLREEHRDYPSVKAFGCSPSMSLGADMSVSKVVPVVDGHDTEYRSCGFHVHQQTHTVRRDEGDFIEYVMPKVAAIDATLGLLDVIMADLDGDTKMSLVRRETIGYGRGGEFRVSMAPLSPCAQEYACYKDPVWGVVEYRTLSPWWLSSPMWTWYACSAWRQIVNRLTIDVRVLPDRSEVLEAINTCNSKLAKGLWERSMKRIPDCGYERGDALARKNRQLVLYAIKNGGHKLFAWDGDLNKAWFHRVGQAPLRTTWSERLYVRNKRVRENRAPINRAWTTFHEGGKYRSFSNGPEAYLKMKLGADPKLPDLSKPFFEEAS